LKRVLIKKLEDCQSLGSHVCACADGLKCDVLTSDSYIALRFEHPSMSEATEDQASLESFDSRLRDIRLGIEYKYLIKHAPGGVYLLPEMDNIRKLHGVVFVRRGLWRNGIFRFLVVLPDNYNTTGCSPHVFFTPPIYNPLVHAETGKLDLTIDDSLLTEWQQDKHFLHTIAMAIKKIFYIKSFSAFPAVANQAARVALETDKPAFLAQVEACVNQSLALVRRFEAEGGDESAAAQDEGLGSKCPMVFTEPKPAHEVLLRQILMKEGDPNSNGMGAGISEEGEGPTQNGYFDATEELEDGEDRKGGDGGAADDNEDRE